MVNIFDLILIAIAIFVIVRSAKKGFVSSCLDTCSVVISGIASFKLYETAAKWVYDLFIGDLVKTSFAKVLEDTGKNIPFSSKVDAMLAEIPESAIKLASGMGIDVESLVANINQSIANDNDLFVDTLANEVGYPVMIFVTEIVVFIVLMVAITFLVRFLANFLSGILRKVPLVGSLDGLLGGVLGVVKAFVILVAVSTVFYIILATAQDGSPLESIANSGIYQFLAENNPVISMIK